MKIRTKRVYEPPAPSDGFRVLVDRVWPRGMRKEAAQLDLWLKDIAPSTTLRRWFDHREDRWEKFRTDYRKELRRNSERIREALSAAKGKTVTLLYGAHDTEHNNAVVLAEYLTERRK